VSATLSSQTNPLKPHFKRKEKAMDRLILVFVEAIFLLLIGNNKK